MSNPLYRCYRRVIQFIDYWWLVGLLMWQGHQYEVAKDYAQTMVYWRAR